MTKAEVRGLLIGALVGAVVAGKEWLITGAHSQEGYTSLLTMGAVPALFGWLIGALGSRGRAK